MKLQSQNTNHDRAQSLRHRVLHLAERAKQMDNCQVDRDSRANWVNLQGIHESVPFETYRDTLVEAKGRFSEQGIESLQLTSGHGQGLGGEFRATVETRGDVEHYQVAQDGYHGAYAFRGEFLYDRRSQNFQEVNLRPGPPKGLEAVKEVVTSPSQMACIAGIGLTGGLLSSAVMNFGVPGTVLCCCASTLMLGVAAVAIQMEG